jgi:hypothetical protein
MHKIEQAILAFAENIENIDVATLEEHIEKFGEDCKKAIRDNLLAKRSEEPFKLRMSNLGKPLRQLMLEKLHGRSEMDAQMRFRMAYGYIWESFTVFLLKAAGLSIEEGKQVTLSIPYAADKPPIEVNGTMDIKIDGEIYDIKSASSWSFDNKFTTFDNMESDDPFGYCGQAFGYSIADKSRFAGWIVCDKSDGRIKVVEVPQNNYKALATKYYHDFKDKCLALFTEGWPIPECTGVEEETFRKVKTGNLRLTKSCEFCNHKYKCHPELQYQPEAMSEAKNRSWKYYTRLVKPSR